MYLSTTLANDQLDAQFPYFIIRLLQSSTCFEQRRAHHEEVNCTNTAASVMVTLKKIEWSKITKIKYNTNT